MYLCICKGITEQQVLDEINKGFNAQHPSAQSELLKRLGVGSDCGTCIQDALEQMVQKAIGPKSIKDPK